MEIVPWFQQSLKVFERLRKHNLPISGLESVKNGQINQGHGKFENFDFSCGNSEPAIS